MIGQDLTKNRWAIDHELEQGMVVLAHIHQIDRARQAIGTIARLIGNSAARADETGEAILENRTVASLADGVEGLSAYIGLLAEDMLTCSNSNLT